MKIGDIVYLDKAMYGQRPFTIEKVNRATFLLAPLDGGTKVRASKELVVGKPRTLDERLDRLVCEHLVCGTLVRISLPAGKTVADMSSGDLGVVLRDNGERVNVARLGGFEDRYGRFPHRMLTVVPAEMISFGADLPRDL